MTQEEFNSFPFQNGMELVWHSPYKKNPIILVCKVIRVFFNHGLIGLQNPEGWDFNAPFSECDKPYIPIKN